MRNLLGLFLVLAILVVIPSVDHVFAQADEPAKYIDRRVLIWNLFFKLMTVAFTVGAVVSGTLIWIVWRFGETHPQAKPTEYEKSDTWGGPA